MKNLLILFILASCHTTAPSSTTPSTTPTVSKIVFNTGTRGYQRETTLTKDSAIIIINSTMEPSAKTNWRTKLTAAEWERLMGSLKAVNISQLNELKSPTTDRATDGAYQSSIQITTDNAYMHSFDDNKPNQQLQQLMDVIDAIEKSRMIENKK